LSPQRPWSETNLTVHSDELTRANRNQCAFRRDNENAFFAISRGSPETAVTYFVDPKMRCHDFNAK
jgi:hypothetical protein